MLPRLITDYRKSPKNYHLPKDHICNVRLSKVCNDEIEHDLLLLNSKYQLIPRVLLVALLDSSASNEIFLTDFMQPGACTMKLYGSVTTEFSQ